MQVWCGDGMLHVSCVSIQHKSPSLSLRTYLMFGFAAVVGIMWLKVFDIIYTKVIQIMFVCVFVFCYYFVIKSIRNLLTCELNEARPPIEIKVLFDLASMV